MPFIQVNLGAGRTPEQKRAMLDGIVEVVHETLGASYESIRVWVVELDPDATMIGDESLAEQRARLNPA
ncbi:MAG: tautomerase family protein [Planctomycetales bacterium]|nr:tautomerase family protein [Planctomycetales bacterium]